MSVQPSLALQKPQTTWRPQTTGASSPRPRLQVVPAVAKRRHFAWPMWMAIATMLVAALVIPVVINTQMAVTSYEMYADQQELSQLQDYHADLVTRAREAQSPQKLAEKAKELGLVPAGNPGYISIEAGTITAGEPAK